MTEYQRKLQRVIDAMGTDGKTLDEIAALVRQDSRTVADILMGQCDIRFTSRRVGERIEYYAIEP